MNNTLAIATAAALACSVLYGTASAAAPRYQLTQLNAIATAVGTYAQANAINDNGQVVGGEAALIGSNNSVRVDWTRTRPILWDAAGGKTLLPSLTGYGGIATNLNNGGLIVGVSASTLGTSPPQRATIFSPSNATLLPTAVPGSNGSLTAGINKNGLVVAVDSGTVYTVDANSSATTKYNATSTIPVAINDQGVIVGNIYNGLPKPALIHLNTAPTLLYTQDTYGAASDLNNNGDAVGAYATSYQDPAMAAIYANGTVNTFTLGSLPSGYANGINDRGDVVGIAGNAHFSAKDAKAFLRRDGSTIDLSTLISGGTLPVGFVPTDINDRGQIIGNASFDHDNNASTPAIGQAYILNPIRNPGDANNDNVVNFDDLVTLAQNYNKAGENSIFWESGDFNYDRAVNFDDLTVLAQNYNKTTSFAADWALAQALVPEPVAAITASAMLILSRRNRRLPVL